MAPETQQKSVWFALLKQETCPEASLRPLFQQFNRRPFTSNESEGVKILMLGQPDSVKVACRNHRLESPAPHREKKCGLVLAS
ncbi:hypothetical protein BaRGS_00032966 [Batillaria attramentaria]|uniref:Uncharacterized protein n=1 Tax=Batillaria attramentaria TaxID=370345 RepID=A0ABD0JLI0_9CAEN